MTNEQLFNHLIVNKFPELKNYKRSIFVKLNKNTVACLKCKSVIYIGDIDNET